MYAFERCSPLFLNDLLIRLAHRGHAMARAPRLAAATSLLLLLALLQNAAGQTTLQVLCLRCVVLECSIHGPVSGGLHLRYLIWQNHRTWRPPYPQDSSCYAFNLGTKSGSNFGAVKGQVRLWIVFASCRVLAAHPCIVTKAPLRAEPLLCCTRMLQKFVRLAASAKRHAAAGAVPRGRWRSPASGGLEDNFRTTSANTPFRSGMQPFCHSYLRSWRVVGW